MSGERATKRCPMCAEDVWEDARICRYCRHEFAAAPPQAPRWPETPAAQEEAPEEAPVGGGSGGPPAEDVDLGRWTVVYPHVADLRQGAEVALAATPGGLVLTSGAGSRTIGWGSARAAAPLPGELLVYEDESRVARLGPLVGQSAEEAARAIGGWSPGGGGMLTEFQRSVAPPEIAANCPRCGAQVGAVSRYCSHCGSAVASPAPSSAPDPGGIPVVFGELGVAKFGQPKDDDTGFRLWVEMLDERAAPCTATGKLWFLVASVKEFDKADKFSRLGPDRKSIEWARSESQRDRRETYFREFDIRPADFDEGRLVNGLGLDRPLLSWDFAEPRPVLKIMSFWGGGNIASGLKLNVWFRPDRSSSLLHGYRSASMWSGLPNWRGLPR